MRELSVFIDESGSDGLRDRYYLVTLVLHEQDDDLSRGIALYEQSLLSKELPNIPFHASPLLNGHDEYKGMNLALRKRLLSAFRVFFRHTPVRYTCIALKTSRMNMLGTNFFTSASQHRKQFGRDKLCGSARIIRKIITSHE